MIQIYTGVPGSGKSYKMVYDLKRLVDREPDVTVISNINGLKIPHLDFDELVKFSGDIEQFFCMKNQKKVDVDEPVKSAGDIEQFFRMETQQKLNDEYCRILYVLDECQTYFPKGKKLPWVENYFQRHRHLGHYVYLATQSVTLINTGLKPLIEFEFNAARRTMSFAGEFSYRVKSPQSREIIETIRLRPRKDVFELYKSFEAEEIQKPKPKLLKKILIPVLICLPAFYWFYQKNIGSRSGSSVAEAAASAPVSPSARVFKESTEQKLMAYKLLEKDQEIAQLKEKLATKTKVYLPVIDTGEDVLTICPDTNAIVSTKNIKRRVFCPEIAGVKTCWYEE